MPDQYFDKYNIPINKRIILVLIIPFVVLSLCYEYFLFSNLSSERLINQGLAYLEKARLAPKNNLLEKSLLYQDALKIIKMSIMAGSLVSRPYFEIGEIITEISNDKEISSSIDITLFGGKENSEREFYLVAGSYYETAISREPTNAVYHQRLGSIYVKLLNTEKAETEFQKAVLLAPQNVTLHIYLSQYFLARGKQKEYLLHLGKVVELYKASLGGGGPLCGIAQEFFKSINREDLI